MMLALIKAAKKGGSGIHISSTIVVLYCVTGRRPREWQNTEKQLPTRKDFIAFQIALWIRMWGMRKLRIENEPIFMCLCGCCGFGYNLHLKFIWQIRTHSTNRLLDDLLWTSVRILTRIAWGTSSSQRGGIRPRWSGAINFKFTGNKEDGDGELYRVRRGRPTFYVK